MFEMQFIYFYFCGVMKMFLMWVQQETLCQNINGLSNFNGGDSIPPTDTIHGYYCASVPMKQFCLHHYYEYHVPRKLVRRLNFASVLWSISQVKNNRQFVTCNAYTYFNVVDLEKPFEGPWTIQLIFGFIWYVI